MAENKTSEQLEEGEIVDDGEFEDISDNSIIESTFGKFVSSNENLRALSLSSDSDCDKVKEIRYRKKLLRRKTKLKHQRRRKKRRIATDSSDSDSSPPRDLKGKLKEAIHISDTESIHKNPLEARLKAMGGLIINIEPTPVAAEPPKPEENGDKVDDTELENLRMEALKTAVLNKFQRRKRKKAALEGKEVTVENKENDTPKDEQNDKIHGEKGENNAVTDLEEDEDVLRASLLAGLAKKIAKKTTPNESVIPSKPVAPKLPVKVTRVLPRKLVNNLKSNIINNHVNKKVIQKVSRPKPQVKPLIINVNDDSDTDDELKRKKTTPQQTVAKVSKPLDVDKFLKEQREKFEAETQKRSQVINKNKTILEKSAVKLLPKSQQIEYQQLLKKLRTAERRKLAKRLALQKQKASRVTVDVSPEGPIVEITTKKAPPPEIVVIEPVVETESAESKQISNEDAKSDSSQGSKLKSSRDSDTSERRSRVTTELTTLQKTLKEIKMQKNGSLQIKSKYQVLTPIIRKITETSNQRKKHERHIKKLLQELGEARSCLANSHEQFTNLVRELVAKKEQIDQSYQELQTGHKRKENGVITVVRKRSESVDRVRVAKSAPVTSTPIKTQVQLDVVEEPTISTFVTSSTNHECEDMDVCNSDETDICQIDIVDPNDIDQIFKRKPPIKSTIPEYVSPLNFNAYDRYGSVDPLGIMCPYEVNGSCRDIDCTYKHYLKNHERL